MAYGTLVADAVLTLRRWLETSKFAAETRLPSERVLARQLGLGHYALNRAMSRLIAEGLVERDGYKLSYTPNKGTGRRFSCDLVVPRTSVFLKSYCRVAKELDIDLKVHRWDALEEATALLHQLGDPQTESVLFDSPHGFPASIWHPAALRLVDLDIPIVTACQHASGIPSVVPDHPRALQIAFDHLREAGHREMALVTAQPRAAVAIEVLATWTSLCRQHGLASSGKRTFFQNNALALREDARELAQQLAKDWRPVTALVVYSENKPAVAFFVEELARRQRQIPKNLSVVYLDDTPALQTSAPPISATAFDMALLQETAFRLLQRMARKKKAAGLLPPARAVLIPPEFHSRASVAVLPSAKAAKKRASSSPFPAGQGERKASASSAASSWKRPYALTSLTDAARYVQADLAPFVNRPLNYRKGWLGDLPLKGLASGTHLIHGVPFQVLGGTSRSDCGAVVFQSTVNTTGSARKLPSRLTIPIGAKVRAVYVLHGCGYARFLQSFASYSFFSGKTRLGSQPLITLGQPFQDAGAKVFSEASLKANIQDWWPDFPHVDFPHARHVPIVHSESEEIAYRNRYLYTLEWINPRPNAPVTHMEVEVNPAQSTTLGLLAVSALR